MSRQTFVLNNDRARQFASAAVMKAPENFVCEIKEPTRNTLQNSRLWALLTDVSQQVIWYGKKLSPENWKHVFTSSLRKLEVVPNLEGNGFVALGLSTSRMSVKEMCDLQTLIEAFGDEHNVRWSAPSYYEE